MANTWLLDASKLERSLSIAVHPITDFIESTEKNSDDAEIVQLLNTSKIPSAVSPTTVSDGSPKHQEDSCRYVFKNNWRIVVTHPVFGAEYKKYIGKARFS